MDRSRTIFLNIMSIHNDKYGLEMHTIIKIIRNCELKETILITDDSQKICVPMEENEHQNFMKTVFSNKEIWFSYVGFFKLIFNNMADEYRHAHKNEFASERARNLNKKISFSVIGNKE